MSPCMSYRDCMRCGYRDVIVGLHKYSKNRGTRVQVYTIVEITSSIILIN